jgi:formate--tetrahydrofolate ligase
LTPHAVVLVVTRRAYRLHGLENIQKHAENLALFGVPVVICINRFADDKDEDLAQIAQTCRDLGLPAEIADYREGGGEGGLELAERVVEACAQTSLFRPLYELQASLKEKIETLALRLYGADGVDYSVEAEAQLKQISNFGYAELPICMAKTPASLSDDAKLPGRPQGFRISVKGARVSAGAGFVVIYTGAIMTMPGLPKKPAAQNIDIDHAGVISGLF